MNNRVLIIGGTGYIGSALTANLRTVYDYDVTTADIGWFSENDADIPWDMYDLTDGWDLEQYDTVILLAGHSSVKMCWEEWGKNSILNNVSNLMGLVMKLPPTTRFIYMSSSSVYGNTKDLNVTEDHPLGAPHNFYDFTKQVIDNYMLTLDRKNW